jgi:hypothetical protein
MSDGSTASPHAAPFAVGYGNGYGYESLPEIAPAPAANAAAPRWGEAAAAAAVTVDPDATVAIAALVATPVAAGPAAPYVARPVGAAHPRRRFGRGLVLAGVALLVAGTGIGATALVTGTEVHPASAASAGSARAALATASAVGDQLGRGVDPHGAPVVEDPSIPVPASIIDPVTTIAVPTTDIAPMSVPPVSLPPTTAPPTTAPPTTTPPTTAPPTTTTPPASPTFTTLAVPSTVECPTPSADADATFSWTAPGATKVTLSIDGPGIYRTYDGATGTETVSFPCGSSHTYLFTAFGSGGSVTTASFTVSPS